MRKGVKNENKNINNNSNRNDFYINKFNAILKNIS